MDGFNDFISQQNKANPVTEKPKKWALSKIFFFEGLIVIAVALLVSLVSLELGVTKEVKPASMVIRSIILWVCAYIMYIVYLAWGSQKGKETKFYQDAINEYNQEREKNLKEDYTKLSQYCLHYVKEELKSQRIMTLSEIGLKYEEYERLYLGKSVEEIKSLNIPEEKKSVIMQANSIKPTKLTPSMIMTSSTVKSRNLLNIDTETLIKKDKFIKIITSALFSLVIGSVFIDISIMNGWAVVITCVLNLLPLVMNIFLGGFQGYKAYSVNEVENLKGKITHFKNCLKFKIQENENKEI